MLPLSHELEEKFFEFQSSIKNEFNLFMSLNNSQSIQKNVNKSIYSFKRFTYEKNIRSMLRIYNKKDVFNKYIYLVMLKSFQEKLLKNDKNSKICLNKENFITFLKKNEKIKNQLQFYDKELPYNLNSLFEKLNKANLLSNQYFDKMSDFKKDLEYLYTITDFFEKMPEGLKQIINIWRKK